jgi:hypothetical protein
MDHRVMNNASNCDDVPAQSPPSANRFHRPMAHICKADRSRSRHEFLRLLRQISGA